MKKVYEEDIDRLFVLRVFEEILSEAVVKRKVVRKRKDEFVEGVKKILANLTKIFEPSNNILQIIILFS